MKKITVLLFALILVLSLAACGAGESGNSGGNTPSTEPVMINAYIDIDYPDESGIADVDDLLMQIPEGTTAFEMLQLYAQENNVEIVFEDRDAGKYVTSINGIAENSRASWAYEIDDAMTLDEPDRYVVKEGQEIIWEYDEWHDIND